jgi:CheY-like chemotaxis protein
MPAPSDSPDGSAKATILVVDDDADTRASLAELLEDDGYRVIAVEDGQKAHDYLAKEPLPDCVVLDLWMPVVDGWTVAAQVNHGPLPRVPIVVVTASNAYLGYPVPSRHVMRKPVDPGRLLALVDELIRESIPRAS